MCIYEVLTSKTPWTESNVQVAFKVAHEGKRPPVTLDTSSTQPELVELMRETWVQEPHSRPGMDKVLLRIEGIVKQQGAQMPRDNEVCRDAPRCEPGGELALESPSVRSMTPPRNTGSKAPPLKGTRPANERP